MIHPETVYQLDAQRRRDMMRDAENWRLARAARGALVRRESNGNLVQRVWRLARRATRPSVTAEAATPAPTMTVAAVSTAYAVLARPATRRATAAAVPPQRTPVDSGADLTESESPRAGSSSE